MNEQTIVARMQQDAESYALLGNMVAAYQAISGVALAKQLIAAIQERDAKIAELEGKEKPG